MGCTQGGRDEAKERRTGEVDENDENQAAVVKEVG
jgi:hypothetical protein